jgi:hypothetical protein
MRREAKYDCVEVLVGVVKAFGSTWRHRKTFTTKSRQR